MSYEILEVKNKPFLSNDSFSMIIKYFQCEYSDEQLKELVDFISFKNMRKIKSINRIDDTVKSEKLHSRKRFDTNVT